VQLCPLPPIVKGALRTSPGGIVLTAAEGASLARQFLTRPVNDSIGTQCVRNAPQVLMRFTTAYGVVDVPMGGGDGCPIVYVDGHAHTLDQTLRDYLIATAAEFDVRGAVAPDVVGIKIKQARTIVRKSGFQLNSIEQEPDGAVAAGTILLQSPPAHHRGLDNHLRFLDVIVAAPATAAACLAGDLVVYYDGSEGGGGIQFGGFVVRNVGPASCHLSAPISLVGLDAAGRTVTNTLRYEIAPGTILTPRAPSVPPDVNPPAGVFLGRLPIVSDPRDDNTPDGLCHTLITPATWRLEIGGATRAVPNRVASGSSGESTGLPTCKGRISSMTVTAYSAP
jgi:hypothetical protein